MAMAVVTMKIMPESPSVDFAKLEVKAKKVIAAFAGEGETRVVLEPIAFGLKAMKITFVMDESLGSPDVLEDKIMALPGVNSFEISDVRRAVG
jgi:elongation factor 1-beta